MSSLEIPRCQHIKVNGVQCGSPALRHKKFCFFHQRWRRYPKTRVNPKGWAEGTWFELPPLEDANSVQEAVMQVTRLVLRGGMDTKTAGVVLYAMQIANCNLKHLSFEPDWKKVVVNPQAVRYSPIENTSDSPEDLEKENQLLTERLLHDPAKPRNESNESNGSGEAAKPCATVAAALTRKIESRHALPTSPEEWDALKNEDFTAWMMALTSMLAPPGQIAEIRADRSAHPENYPRTSDPDAQLLTTLGSLIEAEDREKEERLRASQHHDPL